MWNDTGNSRVMNGDYLLRESNKFATGADTDDTIAWCMGEYTTIL